MNDFNQTLTFAVAETQYSNVYDITPEMNVVETVAEVTALGGTTPELDITVQFSKDKDTWTDEQDYDTIDATGTSTKTVEARALYMRYKLVLTGTDPTATVVLFAQARNVSGMVSNPVLNIINKELTVADTEYSQAISDNTHKILIKARSLSEELKIAFKETKSGTEYYTIPAGSGGQWIDLTNLTNVTLYMQSPGTAVMVEILEVSN